MQQIIKPWYQQVWPWLLVALPGSAVVAGFISLYLAVHKPDSLVAGDYYKEGLAINRHLNAQQMAQQLHLHAVVKLDRDNHSIDLALTGQLTPLPKQLTLRLIHPTLASQDRQLSLTQTSPGHYSSIWPLAANSQPNTQWQIVLSSNSTTDNRWEMSTQIVLSQVEHWDF